MIENTEQIENVTLGADIEVFLEEKETKKLISSVGLIPGSKTMPHYIGEEGYALETDNVSTEFLIPIFTTSEELIVHVNYMRNVIQERIPGYLSISKKASGTFCDEELDTLEAKTFGCEPDFNAWTNKVNKFVKARSTNLRTNGFHIHIGYKNPSLYTSLDLIKAMDLCLGVPSIILDPDIRRRSLYGKAGAYRIKPYGVEYRVLSNYFINSDQLMEFIVNGTYQAVKLVNNYTCLDNDMRIPKCINTNNPTLARNILGDYDNISLTLKTLTHICAD